MCLTVHPLHLLLGTPHPGSLLQLAIASSRSLLRLLYSLAVARMQYSIVSYCLASQAVSQFLYSGIGEHDGKHLIRKTGTDVQGAKHAKHADLIAFV